MKTKLIHITTTLLFYTLFVLPNNSFAQAGSLDLTFDTDGKVTTNFGKEVKVFSIAIQTDSKIVVAGYTANSVTTILGFTLARYNPNGSLDSSFSADGKVKTEIDFGLTANETSLAIQSDGKILVVGTLFNLTDRDIVLVRYNPNGSLDLSFDTDGIVTTAIGAANDFGLDVVIQADGKILVAGSTYNGSNHDFALVRYNTNGSLDNSFDTDGKVTTAIGLGLSGPKTSLAIQSDGKILVAGAFNNGPDGDFALVRYNTNGSVDLGFDTDGIVSTDLGASDDVAMDIEIQGDGKILVAGYTHNGSNFDFALVRYNTNGSLDLNFDTDGKVTSDIIGGDIGISAAIQSDGKILVAGACNTASNSEFALLRYNIDGSLDQGFDIDGKVTTPVGTYYAYGTSVAIQSDGKILMAGSCENGPTNNFAVVRYNNFTGTSMNEVGEVTKIDVFPNPFSTLTTLQTDHPLENATLTFYNIFGQQVKQIRPITIEAGNTITLTRDNLPNGIYFIKLIEDNQIISTNKLVITD